MACGRSAFYSLVSAIIAFQVGAMLQAGDPPVGAPPQPIALDAALDRIPDDARALVLLDGRLYRRISGDLLAYVRAAAARREFPIAVLPVIGLDDRQPPEIRRALQAWRAARPALEGTLFVGNVKLPSFFMPRVDIPSTRLWPRYFEDLDMTPERKIPPGTILGECGPERPWPCVVGRKEFEVPDHDFDAWTRGPSEGPELWAAFLPVGLPGGAGDDHDDWATQLAPFFRKAVAFHDGTTTYGRGLYLISNDTGLLARSRPVWDAVGPKEIEFYAINEKGPGAFKGDPAGYIRADLEKFPTLDGFLAHAGKLPWMDEGWQSAEVFLAHMKEARRRFVWWNVHSNPTFSLITSEQASQMEGGGLIALLNGCSAAGFRQPGSRSLVDVRTLPGENVMVRVVYGRSAFLAALGTPHDRVDDEHATPLFDCLYSGGYLGMAHLLRVRQQDGDSPDPGALRGRQEMLIGDPFLDARPGTGSAGRGAAPAAEKGKWMVISDTLLEDLKKEGKEIGYPGGTTGVAADRTTGESFVLVPGQGVWRSAGGSGKHERIDGGTIGGRCETGWSIHVDPGGRRMAFFMLDGPSGITLDGGRTWKGLAGMGRGWDYGAVDWTAERPKTIFALRHESGGELYRSDDLGTAWVKIGVDPKVQGVGVADSGTLLLHRGAGIERSADGGATWTKVSDLNPRGRVAVLFGGAVYWVGAEGLIRSRDAGKTWQIQGAAVDAGMGPFFGEDGKRMVVIGKKGFFETADGGTTWKEAAPMPGPRCRVDWFGNFAWDPKGDLFYFASMGQSAWKYVR